MNLITVQLDLPEESNVIIGQAHFIKTVEDLAEIVATTAPAAKFGIAFCEASGPCLIRSEGNDPALISAAVDNAERVASGHTFFVFLKGVYPISLLNAVKQCPEVCHIFCATANPVQVIVGQGEQGRAILGVVDGWAPRGVEDEAARTQRRQLLRQLGYKRG
jgi:adenosine/AMP kinase